MTVIRTYPVSVVDLMAHYGQAVGSLVKKSKHAVHDVRLITCSGWHAEGRGL